MYESLKELESRQGATRTLSESASRDCPQRGVYFFFEPGEQRSGSGDGARVVRVGTHALKTHGQGGEHRIVTADQSEAIQAARRWVLTQLALIRDPHSDRSASDAADAAFRQKMGQSHPGWGAKGSAPPDWAAYWEADQQAVNAYASAKQAIEEAERDRLAQLKVAPDTELLELARENLKGYQHSYPRPTTADSILIGIDSRIRSAACVSEYYDLFRDDAAERQIAVLEKIVDAALMLKDEVNYDRAAIFDFVTDLIVRLKDGGYYRDNVHREVTARISNSRRPKGRPGNKPSVRDPLFLALVHEGIRRFGIPAERNDRGRQDEAMHLVGAIIG